MDYVTGNALLVLERAHLVRLAVWAVGSLVVGLLLLVWSRRSALREFWRHAGIQSAAWGLVDLVIVAVAARGLTPRDLAGAVALDRVLWLNIGLDAGYAMVGLTLIAVGGRASPNGSRRPGLVGAGAAIVLQGVALAALDGYLSAAIVR